MISRRIFKFLVVTGLMSEESDNEQYTVEEVNVFINNHSEEDFFGGSADYSLDSSGIVEEEEFDDLREVTERVSALLALYEKSEVTSFDYSDLEECEGSQFSAEFYFENLEPNEELVDKWGMYDYDLNELGDEAVVEITGKVGRTEDEVDEFFEWMREYHEESSGLVV
jgi:hypothetical protein